ncbi:MAG: TetR family transcriptional regulator [Solirubrobacterales bacterium]
MKQRLKNKRGPKGDPGRARAEILASARSEFGKHGFDGATLRAIAAGADVDVALVSYYFGTKADLFVAALELPVNPVLLLRNALEQGTDGAAERLLRLLLTVWDEPTTGAPLVAMMRSLSTQAKVLRRFVEEQLVRTIAAALEGPDADLRAAAFTTHVFGLMLERYVLTVEPLASASHDELVELISPSLQRYLEP